MPFADQQTVFRSVQHIHALLPLCTDPEVAAFALEPGDRVQLTGLTTEKGGAHNGRDAKVRECMGV